MEIIGRRWCRRILQIHKIVSGKSPSYLKNKLPRLRRPLYRQSNSNTFHELKCKSLRDVSNFFPDACYYSFWWYSTFQHPWNIFYLWFVQREKVFFGIHDPLGLRRFFQLRVGLSSIRYHKKCHNFIDTLSDKCLCNQGIEDTNHYLFLCSVFATWRATLAINVIAILQKYNLSHLGNQSHVYLYGHHTINFADNRKFLFSRRKIHKKWKPILYTAVVIAVENSSFLEEKSIKNENLSYTLPSW